MTWVMKPWKLDDEVNVDVHVDSDWAKGPDRKSTSGGMMMINGTVVKHWSRTQATRALSRVLRGRYRRCGRPWNAVNEDRLGFERAGAGLDGLQRRQSDCLETRSREDQARGTEVFVVAGGNQVRESEDEASPRGAEFGRPSDEGEAVARDRRIDPRVGAFMKMSQGQHGELTKDGRDGREGETSVVPCVVQDTSVQRQFGERCAPRKSADSTRQRQSSAEAAAAEAAGAVADPCRVRELWRQMTDRGL